MNLERTSFSSLRIPIGFQPPLPLETSYQFPGIPAIPGRASAVQSAKVINGKQIFRAGTSCCEASISTLADKARQPAR